ncbi:MAG: DUF6796 family protein [Sulfurovaceae bacterium]|nr:hypothetical protein [Sulfurovaceae bacterium]
MVKHHNKAVIITGIIGLITTVLVGFGEFLLHYDSLGRFGAGYEFLRGISDNRTTTGHFIGVLATPFYIVGFWHFMKMLEPADKLWSRVAFAVMSYGIIIGNVWIGSRANISAVINHENISDAALLISLYEMRYEGLLFIMRLCLLVFSGIFVLLVLSGRSHYPKWVTFFNPIFLIFVAFAIWEAIPAIGNYLMPIGLNLAFGLLFLISIYFSNTLQEKQNE